MIKNQKKYTPVIGLEVHIELSTKSKMFCGCPADHFGKKPNTQTCPVCLGLPGALPVPNELAIQNCVKLGLALDCKINKWSNFDRKHYFYPDLPKGYQISQYEDPFCYEGQYLLPSNTDGRDTEKRIGITRVHMEEDTAKLQHTTLNNPSGGESKKVSLVDFNRSGVALVELVTEPDFEQIEDVLIFGKELQTIARYLGISEADMEKGSMRLEANISLREESSDKKTLPNYKVELKNINSYRFLKKAMQYELERQTKLLLKGEVPSQETRGWDEAKSVTFSQRSKETAKDYRYFPDPDIPPIELTDDQIKKIKSQIPELPSQKAKRYKKEFDFPKNYIEILVQDKQKSQYFETAAALKPELAKQIASLMVNKNLDKDYPEPAGLIKKIVQLTKVDYSSTDDTTSAIEEVIKNNPDVVKKYDEGQGSVVGYLIGQTQKLLKGKGDPKKISDMLIKKLQKWGGK
ncbi:Asp-tRNA(Asn)/Glu-tRNA(Gln) amidotransferase subunit GatB [Candidatus Microgenomates bacterium]|nr:Asp-tRNA(Asn)/Glu-tRNA(Gln) amidotransferase subunit GatB [Candidatus Microgenomates bacterium]